MRAIAPTAGLMIALLAMAATPAPAVNVRDHRSPSRGPGVYQLQAPPPVFELTLRLRPGQRMQCETRNLTGQADPVLHVLKVGGGNGAITEIAQDDDSAGALNARVQFSSFLPARVTLVMRAAWNGRGGTADLFCDDRLVAAGLGVGGAFKRIEDLDTRETLRVVAGPGGSRLNTLYVLDDAGRMQARHVSGADDSAFSPGGQTGTRIAMIGGRWPDPTGELHLIRNDDRIPGRDPDGDGLGSRLEAAIGTCSTRTGLSLNFECSRAADPRDTDGDGLPDGLEVMGKLAAAPFLPLPRWGADPRHKDVFIEVDFGMAVPNEPVQKMSPAQVMAFAAIYGDPETSPILRLLHAQQLINPDLMPGVNVHLDIGTDPPAGSPRPTLITYGDWGGFSVVQPVCDSNGACERAKAASVYQTMMDAGRRGIFHYGLGDPGGGGQAGPGIALNFPMGSGLGAAHEFGHTLNLNHEGRVPGVNCTPAYPSIMNYAYLSVQPSMFADGFGRPVVNGVNLRESPAVTSPTSDQSARYLRDLRQVYQLTVDPVTGNVDWDRDGVYAPGTVKAYASYAPNASGGCEVTRDSQMTAQGFSDVAPALVHLGRRTLLFYIDEASRTLRLERSRTALDCPKLGADCGGLEARAITPAWNTGILSVDATTLTVIGGAQRVLVVYRTAAGLFETTMTIVDVIGQTIVTWTTPKPIATVEPAIAEISVTGKDARAWLAYRAQDGSAYLKARDAAGNWAADEPVTDAANAEIDVAPGASPGLLLMTDGAGAERLIGAFPVQPGGAVVLYERNPAAGPWTRFIAQPSTGRIFGRPALAAEPVAAGSPLPARIRMLFVRFSGPTANVVMQSTLVANGIGAVPGMRFVTSQHDNVWLYGNGVDLLFQPGLDTNLRAAVSTALIEGGQPSPHRIVLRPKADGIVDFDQRNFSDWEQIGKSLCTRLKENGAAVTCPAN